MQLSQRIERILDVLLDWILSFYNGEAPFNRIEPRRVRRHVQLDEAFFLENIVDFVTLVNGRLRPAKGRRAAPYGGDIIKQNHGSRWEIQTPDELAKLNFVHTAFHLPYLFPPCFRGTRDDRSTRLPGASLLDS